MKQKTGLWREIMTTARVWTLVLAAQRSNKHGFGNIKIDHEGNIQQYCGLLTLP